MADRSVLVRLRGDVSDFNRAMIAGSASARAFTRSLDTSSDRMGNLVQTSLALGPALVPVGAVAIPAISGLTNQLAFAATGAVTAAIAFQGVGDALGAVNDFSLDPTTASLEKMQKAMATLGPEGQNFVHFLQSLRPEMQQIQNVAQAGLFPGVEAGLTDMMRLLPQAESIITQVSTALGQLVAEAGASLNNANWQEFFTFLEAEAKPTLIDMGRTLGNFAQGFANLWMAFDPLSDQFSQSFLQMSRDFAAWTDGLSGTSGFQEFLDYISRVGPKVGDALGAIGNAFLALIKAAAPVGEVVLPAIEAMADLFAAVANSPVGPVLIGAAAGISAISRAVALYNVANGTALMGLATKMGGKGAGFRAAGAAAGIFALSLTDLDNKMGLTNTATLGLAGAVAGPWGAAIGAGVGLAMDFAASNDAVFQAIEQANSVMANSGASVSELNSAYSDAAQAVADFKASVDDVSITNFASLKNSFEDAFGRSDVEEAEAALDELRVSRDAAIAKAREQQFAEAGLSGAMAGASQATREQTSALLENIAAKNAAADAALGAFDAETRYRDAVLAAKEAAGQNNAGIKDNTAAANANRAIISSLIGTWNQFADSGAASGKQFEAAKKQLLDFAKSVGVGKDELKALAALLHLPKPKPPKVDVDTGSAKVKTAAVRKSLNDIGAMKPNPKVNADTGQAKNKLSGVIDLLRRIVSKSIKIHATYSSSGSLSAGHRKKYRGQTLSAYGNILDGQGMKAFAAGGLEDHRAQIAPPSYPYRVWAEPETGGEAYIPLANDHRRGRALDIWAEVGKRLGVQGFADGGFSGASTIPASIPGDGAASFTPADLERAMNRVFDNREFNANLSADGRRLQLTMRRG